MSQASERELQPGQVIADRCRLEAPLGRGAMGAVWRALHVRLESPVAIKFLNAAIAGVPDMLERFMREARSAAAVRSSHVVQIFDYGVDGSVPYIAMELLLGEPLDERLAARGVLAPPELDKVFGEVACAVSVAHELGVVHRDIKPANIFIAREGGLEVTKVLDFGIAKLIRMPLENPIGSGTHTGIIVGTPNYMSPEQARGHRRVLALTASFSSRAPEPEGHVAGASTPSAGASVSNPVPSAQPLNQPAPGPVARSLEVSNATVSEPTPRAVARASVVAHRAAARGAARAPRPAASSHRARKSATRAAPRASTSIDPYADRL